MPRSLWTRAAQAIRALDLDNVTTAALCVTIVSIGVIAGTIRAWNESQIAVPPASHARLPQQGFVPKGNTSQRPRAADAPVSYSPRSYGTTAPASHYYRSSSYCAENGSCYGDVSHRTGREKTVHVQGYYRKNGTYVRGHYRSRPSRRR